MGMGGAGSQEGTLGGQESKASAGGRREMCISKQGPPLRVPVSLCPSLSPPLAPRLLTREGAVGGWAASGTAWRLWNARHPGHPRLRDKWLQRGAKNSLALSPQGVETPPGRPTPSPLFCWLPETRPITSFLWQSQAPKACPLLQDTPILAPSSYPSYPDSQGQPQGQPPPFSPSPPSPPSQKPQVIATSLSSTSTA